MTLHEMAHTASLVALNEFGVRVDTVPLEWSKDLRPITDRELAVQIYQRCHDREYIFLTNPYPGSVEALTHIAEEFDIYYFTDRKASSYDDTLEWLELHKFPTPENLYCCEDKRGDLTKYRDQIYTVVDDRPRTLYFALTELGCHHVYSMKHSHNQNLTDIPDITLMESWTEFVPAFEAHKSS